MNNKGKLKKQLIDMIDDMGNTDVNIHAYHMCSNCLYNVPVISGFHIMTKAPEGSTAVKEYEDLSKYRNFVYSNVYPRTRNFKCNNKECDTNKKGTPTEAIFFRIGDTYQVVYICTVCHDIKRN